MALDITVLSGFLGSGKTTLLTRWLRDQADESVGVIVNEAGEVDIDGETVLSVDNTNPVTKLPSGCLCCSLRDTLVDTLFTLMRAQEDAGGAPLSRIIIETSGLSFPGPIVASLADPELLKLGFSAQVVSTFDCLNGQKRAESSKEVCAQLAAAQNIVLTKVDQADDSQLAQAVDYAGAINPMACLVNESDKAASARLAFSSPGRITQERLHEFLFLGRSAQRDPHPSVRVFTRVLDGRLDWRAVSWWLDDMSFYFGERMLRSKCVLRLTGGPDPVLMQSVGHVYGQPAILRGRDAEISKFVFIFHDVDDAEFDRMFGKIRQ
jgi:G3E family GTPase